MIKIDLFLTCCKTIIVSILGTTKTDHLQRSTCTLHTNSIFHVSYYILHSLYSALHSPQPIPPLQYLWLILSGVVRHTWVLNVHSHSWKSASKRFRGSWLKRNTIDCVVSVFSVISDTCPWLLQTLLVFCRALPREGAECKVSMFTGSPCPTQKRRQ